MPSLDRWRSGWPTGKAFAWIDEFDNLVPAKPCSEASMNRQIFTRETTRNTRTSSLDALRSISEYFDPHSSNIHFIDGVVAGTVAIVIVVALLCLLGILLRSITRTWMSMSGEQQALERGRLRVSPKLREESNRREAGGLATGMEVRDENEEV